MSRSLISLLLLAMLAAAQASGGGDDEGHGGSDGKGGKSEKGGKSCGHSKPPPPPPYPEYLKGLCSKGSCNHTAGVVGNWVEPSYPTCGSGSGKNKFGPPSDSAPYCAHSNIHVQGCCNKCSNVTNDPNINFNCRFWMHIPQGSSTCGGPQCGKCILFPAVDSDAVLPKKEKGSCTKNIRLGKACPYTKNDPHFLGAHGSRFEFNGLPDRSFCLFTDRRVHVNMGMRGYYDSRTEGAALVVGGKAVRTWIRQLAVMWRTQAGASHSLVLTARDSKEQARGDGFLASAVLDGRALARMEAGDRKMLPGGMSLSFDAVEKVGPFDVDVYSVKVEGLLDLGVRLRVAHPLLQTPDDAQAHINVMFNEVAPTASVHGVMGQTYRSGREQRTLDFARLTSILHRPVSADGPEGKGFLDGSAADYQTSSVTGTDCKYSVFNGGELPATA